MGWVLRLVETGVEGPLGSVDVLEIDRPGNLDDLADLGLRLPDGEQLLSQVQQAVVAAQCRDHAAQRPACRACGAACRVKDWRNSTWLLIRKGSVTYYYTIFNSILALRVLICPNEVSFAPLEGILAGRRRASARRACVTGARRV